MAVQAPQRPIETVITHAHPEPPSRLQRLVHSKWAWVVGLPLALVLVVIAAGLTYLSYLNANTPPALSFADAPLSAIIPGDAGAPATTTTTTTADDPALADDEATSDQAVTDTTEVDQTADGSTTTTTTTTTDDQGATTEPDAPPAAAPAEAPPAGSSLDGTWAVGAGSIAGYRIGYSAVGVRGTRVGRGEAVTGTFAFDGTTVQTGSFKVDFREVKCDGGEQCDQHVQEMMAVDRFPYETFTLTEAIDLGRVPEDGEQVTATAKGQLTLRGKTLPVRFDVTARRNGGRIEVLGSIPVNRDEYEIPDPEEPGFTIDKDGLVEFLLLFDHQG